MLLIASLIAAAAIGNVFPETVQRENKNWLLASRDNTTGQYITQNDFSEQRVGDYTYKLMVDFRFEASVPYRYALIDTTEHCGRREFSMGNSTFYMADGRISSSGEIGIDHGEFLPRSVAEGRHQSVCGEHVME